jgi:hypothetical protein
MMVAAGPRIGESQLALMTLSPPPPGAAVTIKAACAALDPPIAIMALTAAALNQIPIRIDITETLLKRGTRCLSLGTTTAKERFNL